MIMVAATVLFHLPKFSVIGTLQKKTHVERIYRLFRHITQNLRNRPQSAVKDALQDDGIVARFSLCLFTPILWMWRSKL